VLVLGSLPGQASLRAARYYAHPTNQFWRLMAGVIGREDLPVLDYDARIAALNDAGVGLWDTIDSAIRPGSLDAAIRDMAARDLAAFVADLPSLRAVGFNGGTSARIGRRQLAGTALALIDLPSSSAAHAGLPLAAKQERWLALREYLR
jgi:hypoxanthine-DNA glycosylase